MLIQLTYWALLAADPAGHIAYLAGDAQDTCALYIANLESNDTDQISEEECAGAPVWSPDGTRLAHVVRTPRGTAVRVVRADGSEAHLINHAADVNRWPRWSPDGRHIAYSAGEAFREQIAVFDTQSDTETVWGKGQTGLMRPVWMSDSTLIAIWTGRDPSQKTTDIVRVTQSDLKLLTDATRKGDEYFEWAVEPLPGIGALAYESNDGGDREIFVFVPLIGLIDVTNHHAADWNPVWAPRRDSSVYAIAFESFRNGRRGIFRVDPRRLLVTKVSASADWDDWSPAWSPDGEWITHVSNRTGSPHIFVTTTSGRDSSQLSQTHAFNYAPAWRPEPDK